MNRIPLAMLLVLLAAWLGGDSVSMAQTPAQVEVAGPIQDNGFLVEEAYNQEEGIVQHASLLNYFKDSKDWNYGFTQEWPLPFDWRHQFSYALSAVRPGAFSDDAPGFGDVALNYRYQLVGSGKDRVAVAPRFSLFLPAGDSKQGRGLGATGYQVNLPVSIQHNKWIVSHWNVGGTLVPNAKNLAGDQAQTTGFNFGKSLILLAHPNLNLMLETIWTGQQAVAGPDRIDSSHSLFISPGVRWAHNFESGLQIVPGVALAFGRGPSKGEEILVFYLSFEHPFRSAD